MAKLFMACMLIVLAAEGGFAESVFMKDGSIIEGALAARGADELTIVLPNRVKVSIPLNEVLRVAAGDEYKKPVIIKKTDGSAIRGFIVAADDRAVILRKKIDSADELEIEKKLIAEVRPAVDDGPGDKSGPAQELTPAYAAKYSFIPLRSGSFLVESNGWGVLFCVFKTGGLILPLSVVLASSGFGQSSDTGESSAPASPLDNNEELRRWTLISFGVWALATAADAVYSYYYVKDHLAKRSATEDAGHGVTVSVVPRVCSPHSYHAPRMTRPEGMDISVTLRL